MDFGLVRYRLGTGHGYLRFPGVQDAVRFVCEGSAREATLFIAGPALLLFASEPAAFFITVFAGVLGASLLSLSPSSAEGGAVSRKWIGAFFPPEPLPSPNPSTDPTAVMLDLGGVTSALD